MKNQRLILIGGPTASGKSARAVDTARAEGGVIINADAMQIYAGLPVLTAQPDAQDRAEIPHFLYEIADAAEPSSAGKWLDLARDAVAAAWAAGRVPIVVGGTGLYFHVLLNGLADIPPVPEDVRSATTADYDRMGETDFRAALARVDAASAQRIARNDRQRLIRAMEVVRSTGKSLTAWQEEGASRALPPDVAVERLLTMPEREALYKSCDTRFSRMIENGAIDEVRALMQRALPPDMPAMKILGVREIASYLRGESSLEDAAAAARQATRNYAKRQMTWFRNQWRQDG